ncbi:MAG: DUF3050 domain-containing protein [Bacteroidia bacterium]
MNRRIEHFQNTIRPYSQKIINHKVYSAIKDINDLKIFMQYHIYAVWDFMSLLKALQSNLTCISVPWFPAGVPEIRYLINEIVVGEESDLDLVGNRKSHFELYIDAMKQCGANTSQIEAFLVELINSKNFDSAYEVSKTPAEARRFVDFTFKIINSNKAYLQSAIFTFGREDLIPRMFQSIVNDIHLNFPDSISIFKYYLERHIELDKDYHSILAVQMTSNLCNTNELFWKEAELAVIESLQMRIELWDGVYNHLTNGGPT